MRKIVTVEPDIAHIATDTPEIDDAKAELIALSMRERVRLSEVMALFGASAAKMFHCGTCDDDVPLYEWAGGSCLDCVQDAYINHFRSR